MEDAAAAVAAATGGRGADVVLEMVGHNQAREKQLNAEAAIGCELSLHDMFAGDYQRCTGAGCKVRHPFFKSGQRHCALLSPDEIKLSGEFPSSYKAPRHRGCIRGAR